MEVPARCMGPVEVLTNKELQARYFVNSNKEILESNIVDLKSSFFSIYSFETPSSGPKLNTIS